jgi:hypothetical protein
VTVPRLALALFAVLLGGCSCGKKCDPETMPGSCDGEEMVYCRDGRKSGFDFGSSLQHTPCMPGNVCRDFGGGQVGCVHLPATPCEIETYVGGCDGNAPLVCSAPSSFVTETWVIAAPACQRGQRCVETPQGGDCRPN